MSNKRLIILIVLFVIIGIATWVIIKNDDNKKPNENLSTKEKIEVAETIIEDIHKNIMNGEDSDTYEYLVDEKLSSEFILTGPDTYLREKPLTKLTKMEDLTEYEKMSDVLATNVETEIKDNFRYEVLDSFESADGDIVVQVSYMPYYYALYLYDHNEIVIKLMEMAGYKMTTEDKVTDQRLLNYYKARIKASEIMDSHLNEYRNDYEYFTADIIFWDGNMEDANASVESYLISIDGSMSETIDFVNEQYRQTRINKAQKYIDEAINMGLLNENKPLELSN